MTLYDVSVIFKSFDNTLATSGYIWTRRFRTSSAAPVPDSDAPGFNGIIAAWLDVGPLRRLQLSAKNLVSNHSPEWFHADKRLVYAIVSPPDATHSETIGYSRLQAIQLPEQIGIRLALDRLTRQGGFYDYNPLGNSGSIEWRVNFAVSDLFVAYSGSWHRTNCRC